MRERIMPWWFRRRDEERRAQEDWENGSQGQPGQGIGSQEQPGQGISSQGQPGQGIGSQGQPGQGIGSQGQPGQGISSQGQSGQGISSQGQSGCQHYGSFPQRQLPVKPDYTVVSAVNDKLLALLRKHMVPNVLVSREEIGLCTPKDHGDIVFGIYLYDIRENSDVRMTGMQAYDSSHIQFPPIYLELHYMLTAYSAIDLRYREEENHRILTKAMQVIHDYPRMEGEDMLHIEFQNLTFDQKAAVWNNLGGGYQLSLFYKITPIKLESTVRKETVRVQEIRIDASPGAIPGGGADR